MNKGPFKHLDISETNTMILSGIQEQDTDFVEFLDTGKINQATRDRVSRNLIEAMNMTQTEADIAITNLETQFEAEFQHRFGSIMAEAEGTLQ